ncbi:hypothetical protein [Streptomyces sp. NPDC056544]|uniref:hypothetical protein n=1 Tax=Streptomyces sp. NPDC056544 TaxID=3345863 RepID=UPI0036779002
MPRTATNRGEPADPAADRPPPRDEPAFLGRPRGPAALCGPEVRERFSFLGMQAVLVLCFADTVANGGLGMDPGTAASVSAAYGTMVYLVSHAMRRTVRRVVGGCLACAAPTTLLAVIGWLTTAGPAVTATAPWLRRTMHPLH